jgi:galacturan 1,4-alpha-galacturonidase
VFLRNFLRLAVLFSLAAVSDAALNKTGSACVATPLGGTSDDTPQIMDAFKQCGKGGSVAISEGTYNIGQVMDKLDFQNCDNHINGKLVWSADYWLSHSISVIYVGRSTARRIGGKNVAIRGHGKALLDGNGQKWSDENKNAGNQNGRPIYLNLRQATNFLVDGITWKQT